MCHLESALCMLNHLSHLARCGHSHITGSHRSWNFRSHTTTTFVHHSRQFFLCLALLHLCRKPVDSSHRSTCYWRLWSHWTPVPSRNCWSGHIINLWFRCLRETLVQSSSLRLLHRRGYRFYLSGPSCRFIICNIKVQGTIIRGVYHPTPSRLLPVQVVNCSRVVLWLSIYWGFTAWCTTSIRRSKTQLQDSTRQSHSIISGRWISHTCLKNLSQVRYTRILSGLHLFMWQHTNGKRWPGCHRAIAAPSLPRWSVLIFRMLTLPCTSLILEVSDSVYLLSIQVHNLVTITIGFSWSFIF